MEHSKIRRMLRSAVVASALFAGQLAVAQPPEDIVVTGRYGKVPDNVDTLSATVSYADLDLSYAADRKVLRRRIDLTARYLCDKLGESDTVGSVVPSCREAAVRDAMRRIGTIEQHFAPRGTAWVRGPVWVPPYPADWNTRYR